MSTLYLDNAATTRVIPEVAAVLLRAATETYGNPSSVHGPGADARRAVEDARGQVATALGVDASEITFTSGGTEANNLAIRGLPGLRAGHEAILSAVEHPSVHAQAGWLRDRGLEVSYAPVDRDGVTDLEALAGLLSERTRLVAVMAVNNETGSIQPIPEIVARVRERAPEARVHCDVVQAFCKLPTPVRSWGVDSASCSAHKIHGPKGTGALYLRAGLALHPRVGGGSQERSLRPGTENVPGVAAFGAAVAWVSPRRASLAAKAHAARERFFDRLPSVVPGAEPLVDQSRSAHHILAVRVPGCRSETLLHFLEREGVCISSGSACHADSTALSHVLEAMGHAEDPGSFRASVGADTPDDALDRLLDALARVVGPVREICSRGR